MKFYEVHYNYKARHKASNNRYFVIRVKAEDEHHAKKIAYNKIDTRIFELI